MLANISVPAQEGMAAAGLSVPRPYFLPLPLNLRGLPPT